MTFEQTITLEDCTKSENKGYWFRKAKELLTKRSGYQKFVLMRRGGSRTPANPLPGEILYVAATPGRWGKSASIRYGEPKNY